MITRVPLLPMVTLPPDWICMLSLRHMMVGVGFPIGRQFSSSCSPRMTVVVAGRVTLGATEKGGRERRKGEWGGGRGERREGGWGGRDDEFSYICG